MTSAAVPPTDSGSERSSAEPVLPAPGRRRHLAAVLAAGGAASLAALLLGQSVALSAEHRTPTTRVVVLGAGQVRTSDTSTGLQR